MAEGPWGTLFVRPGRCGGGAAHMTGMTDDSTPTLQAALDSEPDSRLAISLYNLNSADDALLIGLDLVNSYARTTDPVTLTGEQATDVARFRRALDILGDQVLLAENYYNLPGKFGSLTSGTEAAREMVQRIVAAEPVLARIVSDRCTQQTRGRLIEPAYLGYIESTLDSDLDARLAISLDRLDHEDISRAHVREVRAWVKDVDLSTLTGQLANDAGRIRRATEILADRILLEGMTFWNLQINVRDLGGSIYDYATSTPAREIVDRIAAAAPGLAEMIAAHEPETTF